MKNIFTSLLLFILAVSTGWTQENRQAVISGYIQENQSTFQESVIYLRSATNYNREGYLVFGVNNSVPVTNVTLRLYPSDVQNNAITQVDFSAGEGNLIEGMTWDTRPTALEALASVDLADDDEYIELEITDYYNDLVEADEASFFTIRLVSTTTNAFAQFFSTTSSVADKRPVMIVLSDCPAYNTEMDTIACVGTNPVLGGEPRTEDGIYYDSLTRVCGADSVIMYNLLLIQDATLEENVSICEGDSYQGFTETGVHTVTLVSGDGACEQVTEITLTVNENPTVDLGEDITISEDEAVTLEAGTGFASYLWSDGTTGESVIVSSEAFTSGDVISVTVTDDNGCSGSDEVTVTITENAVKPSRDGYIREYDDTYFNTISLEVKNDQYGDLENPGSPPFWSREAYLAFELPEFDAPLTDVKLRLYLYNITFVDATPNDPIPVEFGIAPELYDDEIKWSTKPAGNAYQQAGTVTLSEDDVNTFIEVDINDYMQDNILGQTNEFSIRITTYTDANSSMVKFRSLEQTTEAQQPRLIYSFGEEEPPVSGIEDEINQSVHVYPNPVIDRLKLDATFMPSQLVVRDLAGKVHMQSANVMDEIDVSSLPAGVYLITISGYQQETTRKFIKQ